MPLLTCVIEDGTDDFDSDASIGSKRKGHFEHFDNDDADNDDSDFLVVKPTKKQMTNH